MSVCTRYYDFNYTEEPLKEELLQLWERAQGFGLDARRFKTTGRVGGQDGFAWQFSLFLFVFVGGR